MTLRNEEKIQKNSEILINQWVEELENTMNKIEEIIKEDFYTGVWGFLFNRIVAAIYGVFFSKDIQKKIINQLEIVIEAGKEYNENLDEILEKYYEDYLALDPGYERCKKKHPKASELKERLKTSLILMVKGTNVLLESEGDCFDDLLINAYKTKEEAKEATFKLIHDAEANLEFTIQHKMVKISRLIRNQVIKILKKEIEIGKDYYTKKLDELYGK